MKKLKSGSGEGKRTRLVTGNTSTWFADWYGQNRYVAVGVGLIGIVVLAVIVPVAIYHSMAASGATSFEAESGQLSGQVAINSDANAAAGTAVKFGAAASSSCGLTGAVFCEDFEGGIASPRGQSGDFNQSKLSVGRMQGTSNSGDEYDFVQRADIPACRSGSATNPLPQDDFLICDPVSSRNSHHALVSATVQNYGDAVARINQPFDFAGRTGIIRMDLSIDDEKALSGSPEFILSDQPNAVASIEDENGKGTGVSNGFIVQFRLDCSVGSNGPLVRIYNDYAESQLSDTRYGQDGCDAQNKVQTAVGKMNRFEIRLSRTSLEIYGTDFSNDGVNFGAYKKIFSSVPINLPFTRTWLSFGVHNHASIKYYSKTTEYHYFDNVAFDGPAIAAPSVYSIPDNTAALNGGVNMGWPFQNRNETIMAPLTFSNVNTTGATSAKMLFDFYADAGLNPYPGRQMFYRFNGGAWRQYTVPPGVVANDAMIAHRSMYTLDISLADLVSGNNTVQFSSDNLWHGIPTYVANVDLMVWK